MDSGRPWEWRPNVYGQCKSWLDMGLQPRAVSRDLDWGIPVPVEGAEGKVLYVWFDALSATSATPKSCCPTHGRNGGKTPKRVWYTSSERQYRVPLHRVPRHAEGRG